jgi:Arc-like DNA binding domain
MARKTEELRPVMTRIPEGLRRRLERSATQNGRSMNTEIIHRLERSFVDETRSDMQLAQQASTTAVEKFIVKLIDPASGPDVLKRISEGIAVEPKTKGEEK